MATSDEERRAADEFYIVATDTSHDERTRVLKQDETFAVCDRYGDLVTEGLGQHGLYHQGTRFLSRYRLALYQHRPMLLGSTISTDNKLLLVDLTNPDLRLDGHLDTPRGTIHLQRKRFLWESTAFEELTVHNYGLAPLQVDRKSTRLNSSH